MAAHRYWRINLLENYQGATNTNIGKLLLAAADGVNVAVDSTKVTGSATGFAPASAVVVGQPDAWWTFGFLNWFAFDLVTPVNVQRVSLIDTTASVPGNSPKRFNVEYSDTGNGLDWVVAWGSNPTRVNPRVGGTSNYIDPLLEPSLTVKSHRYWRVNARGTFSGNFAAFRVQVMAEVNGINIATDGFLAFASKESSVAGSQNGVASSVDLFGYIADTTPGWWGYDFGSSGRYIQRLSMSSSTASGKAADAPSKFDVQWSDDRVAWTTAWSDDNGRRYPIVGGQINAYFDPVLETPLTAGQHRFWRINIRNAGGQASYAVDKFSLSEANGIDRATVVENAYAPSYTAGQEAYQAIVTGGGSAVNPSPGWWAYDAGQGVGYNIVQVCITAANGTLATATPTSFDVQWSDTNNGTDWVTKFFQNNVPSATTAGQVTCYNAPVVIVAITGHYAFIY